MTKKSTRRKHRPRFFRRSKPGAMPGIISPAVDAHPTVLYYIAYGGDQLVEQELETLDDLQLDTEHVQWLDVRGFANTKTLNAIAKKFGIHPLAMEDVVNSHQRPKVETYDDHLFIITRGVESNGKLKSNSKIVQEQLSIFLGKGFVLSFQERPSDSFEPIRKRIVGRRGRIRDRRADYLAYALLDYAIDSFFPAVEHIADRIDGLEADINDHLGPESLREIHGIRNDLLAVRRSLRPQRDACNELTRIKHPLISEETQVFLRDCQDHAAQLLDFVEVYREMCMGLRDYQMSMVSNRMNEVMKVLTIISTIFIPLGFISGLYGMNFNTELPGNMPELNQPFAYLGVLAMMGLIVIGMLTFFWRKGWIGTGGSQSPGEDLAA